MTPVLVFPLWVPQVSKNLCDTARWCVRLERKVILITEWLPGERHFVKNIFTHVQLSWTALRSRRRARTGHQRHGKGHSAEKTIYLFYFSTLLFLFFARSHPRLTFSASLPSSTSWPLSEEKWEGTEGDKSHGHEEEIAINNYCEKWEYEGQKGDTHRSQGQGGGGERETSPFSSSSSSSLLKSQMLRCVRVMQRSWSEPSRILASAVRPRPPLRARSPQL